MRLVYYSFISSLKPNKMKKIACILILSYVLILITACSKTDNTEPAPVAKDPYGMFSYTIKSNGIVSFINTSTDATSYLWDFGDGTTSTTSAASFDHKYSQNGTYKAHLTAYGNGKSAGAFANLDITSVISETITDIDGNVYHAVTIGTQVWLLENLNTTKYRNGDPIPFVTDATAWGTAADAYCNYNNDESNSTTYGRLYNWHAVNDNRNIAPSGWHVANDDEWTTLISYMGGLDVAGGKLKETGTSHWQSPNSGATNEAGFTALPGGYCNIDGSFGRLTDIGYWWSSTAGGNLGSWQICLFSYDIDALRVSNRQNIGLSVRCIRD